MVNHPNILSTTTGIDLPCVEHGQSSTPAASESRCSYYKRISFGVSHASHKTISNMLNNHRCEKQSMYQAKVHTSFFTLCKQRSVRTIQSLPLGVIWRITNYSVQVESQ
uniref:Uncharacterized protein n=1 Tax=Setaria italica TaxID=4555 RepID=K3XNG1_SETIT